MNVFGIGIEGRGGAVLGGEIISFICPSVGSCGILRGRRERSLQEGLGSWMGNLLRSEESCFH